MRGMKRPNVQWTVLISIALAMPGAACLKAGADEFAIVGGYDIGFSFPKGWKAVKDKTPYDLQYTNGQSYASVFAFNPEDLAQGQTPADIFRQQREALAGKRKNVEFLSEQTVADDANTRIRSVLFSGEKDGSLNHYYCNLVELKAQPRVFAWLLFSATPSVAKRNMDVWKTIAASARPAKR